MPGAPLRITRPTVAVLTAFLDDPTADHYGLDVARAAGLSSGTLYPILHRMVDWGWATCWWEDSPDPGRPRRRYYRLSGEGVRMASSLVEKAAMKPRFRPASVPGPAVL